MKEYKKGETVRIPITVHAPAGLMMVEITAHREHEPGDPPDTDFGGNNHILLVAHSDENPTTETKVVLEGEVTHQVPGTYSYRQVLAYDVHQERQAKRLDPPVQFSIVADETYPGKPEIGEVGEPE